MNLEKNYQGGNAAYILIISLGILAIVAYFAVSTYAPFKDKLFGMLYSKQFSFASTNPIPTPTPSEPGLIGYWKFDEGTGTVAHDSTVNGSNAKFYNTSLSWQNTPQCIFGGCLSNNGGSGYAQTDPNPLYNITSNVTFNVWAKIDQITTTTWPIIMGNYNSHIGYEIRNEKATGKSYFEYGVGTCDGTTGNYKSMYFSPNSLADGKWHMYTMTQGGNYISIYLDGVLVGLRAQASFCPLSGINQAFKLNASYLNGSVDEAKVYNLVRSQDQITQDFKKGMSLNITAPKAGETLVAGKTYRITWNSNLIDSVFINWSYGPGSSNPITNSGPIKNTNYYDWVVDVGNHSTSTQVQLVITAYHSGFGSINSLSNFFTVVPTKRVFVTSTTYKGNFGDVSGADSKCQIQANTANLGGIWKSWMSDDISSAGSRLSHNPGPYQLLDGTQIANSFSDFTNNTMQHQINQTEFKQNITGSVWTGTTPSGNSTVNSNCHNWTFSTTDVNSNVGGVVGNSSNYTNSSWTDAGSLLCQDSFQNHLYCLEQ